MKPHVKNLKIRFLKVFVLFCAMIIVFNLQANPPKLKKLKAVVLNIDTKGLNFDVEQMGNMVRLELSKLDTFEVMDKYDVAYMIEKNNIKVTNCYGKICQIIMTKLNVLTAEELLPLARDLFLPLENRLNQEN